MGNITKLENGAQGAGGFTSAYGVAHRLKPHDFALLTAMEHEYRSVLQSVLKFKRICGTYGLQVARDSGLADFATLYTTSSIRTCSGLQHLASDSRF